MKAKKNRWRLWVSAAWVSAACVSVTSICSSCFASPADADNKPKTPAELRTTLNQLMNEKHIPGISYALFNQDGLILAETIGNREQPQQLPVTETTLFQIGSITKTVTAIAIMQLIEQGHFTLQTPLKELLPMAPVVNPFETEEPVRIVHLLSHTAGFDDTHVNAFMSPVERRGEHLQISQEHPEPLHVRWRPGLHHSYSNPGYLLLGAILEAHYHKPWDDIVRAQVLTQLGMTATTALISEAQQRDHATGHSGANMQLTDTPFTLGQADGALWCTATDLAKLGRFVLTNGTSHAGVLSAASMQQMKRVQSADVISAGLNHGYGMGLSHREMAGQSWQGHTGGMVGALASMMTSTERGIGYALLVNSENALRKLELPIAQYLEQLSPTTTVAMSEASAAPTDVVGWYRMKNSRAEILRLPQYLLTAAYLRVDETDNTRLELNAALPNTGHASLTHRGKGLLEDDDSKGVINNAIIRDEEGQPVGLLLDQVYFERVSAFSALAPVSSALFGLIASLTAPFGRRRALHNRWARRLPTLALLTLIVGAIAALNFSIPVMRSVNWQTQTVLVTSIVFPLLAVAGVWVSLHNWRKETARLAKWRCLLGSLGASILAAWFAAFHWFALAVWAW